MVRSSKPSWIKKLGIPVILTQGKDALGFKYFWSVCSLQLPSSRGATAFKQIIELHHNYLVRNKKKYHVSNLHQYHFKRQKMQFHWQNNQAEEECWHFAISRIIHMEKTLSTCMTIHMLFVYFPDRMSGDHQMNQSNRN